MPILHAIVLGITQGLSEFPPISSSGHLRLVPWLFAWDDFAGAESLEKTFDVALHLGTLIGAIAYFRSRHRPPTCGQASAGTPSPPTTRKAWRGHDRRLLGAGRGHRGALFDDVISATPATSG